MSVARDVGSVRSVNIHKNHNNPSEYENIAVDANLDSLSLHYELLEFATHNVAKII
jgi:hypothetical protein